MVLDQVRTYPGWNPATDTTTGAIQVSDDVNTGAASYSETLGYAWSGALPNAGGVPTGAEDFTTSSATLQSLSRSITNDLGQVYEEDDYVNLAGIGYSASTVRLGALNVNYRESTSQYDTMGNLTGSVNSDGNISHTTYDILGRVTSTWVGTSDGRANPGDGASDGWSPTTNGNGLPMVETSASVYDNGVVGDGDLTETVAFPIAPSSGSFTVQTLRVTQMSYDWQDRLIATKPSAMVATSSGGFPVVGPRIPPGLRSVRRGNGGRHDAAFDHVRLVGQPGRGDQRVRLCGQ